MASRESASKITPIMKFLQSGDFELFTGNHNQALHGVRLRRIAELFVRRCYSPCFTLISRSTTYLTDHLSTLRLPYGSLLVDNLKLFSNFANSKITTASSNVSFNGF